MLIKRKLYNGSRRALSLLLLLLLLLACLGCERPQAERLSLTVLDVGQSDCILIEVGEQTLLVDSGTATSRAALLSSLVSCGVREIDYLLLSHPHEDHVGNARTVIEQYAVKTLLVPAVEVEDFGYGLILTAAENRGTKVNYVADDMSFMLGEASCTVLAAGLAAGFSENDASLVLRVELDGQVMLLMGDAEVALEERLLACYGAEVLDCDFLKVGHHGSKTATSAAFLAAATPEIAAISCGKNNDYGFPHSVVLENLTAVGAEIWRTDLLGDLRFVLVDGTLKGENE